MLSFGVGVLLIYLGFTGRVLIGVAGGVIAVVALARLIAGPGPVHGWSIAAAAAAIAGVGILMLNAAVRARRNKREGGAR